MKLAKTALLILTAMLFAGAQEQLHLRSGQAPRVITLPENCPSDTIVALDLTGKAFCALPLRNPANRILQGQSGTAHAYVWVDGADWMARFLKTPNRQNDLAK